MAALAVPAFALEVTVTDRVGIPVGGFRWLLEEDNTDAVVAGALVTAPPAVLIHKSYAPVVAAGHSDSGMVSIDAPADRRYFLSVMPDAGFTMGGAAVAVGQTSVRVVVNAFPVPTAQISILAFHDNWPINNAPEVPTEEGLPGFTVVISDLLGALSQDAFGNPLGTTYAYDGAGQPLLDPNDGTPIVDMMGSGIITTDQSGEALVKYLPPGKYGIVLVPPAGEGWIQTTTIEGTPTIDAWVKANEPPVFVEFGPAAYHVFMGFVREFDVLAELQQPGEPTGTISGRVVYNHFSRPPQLQGFFPGAPVRDAWVGLNESFSRRGVYAAACDDSSNFVISGVPAGTYQLVTWDRYLDSIFGFNTVTIPDAQGNWDIDLSNVLAFAWFGTLEGSVFFDEDQDGFRDPGEMGMPDQAVNLRFRDGTIYQATTTTMMGDYSFEEVFPFFKWLVVEVDFARFKDTGYTNIVDYGGDIPPDDGWDMPSRGKLNPQPQEEANPNTGNNLSRTAMRTDEAPGAFLLQGMQLYLGQTNVIDWGKTNYGPGESGGISGIVYYAVTRAEDDPAYAAGDDWEPGVPRVQVVLYQDLLPIDGQIDDLDGDAGPTRADRDNYPLGWADGSGPKGPEDVDWNGNGEFEPGDALQIVWTDSWDDNLPSGCIQNLPVVHGEPAPECFDNFGTWNQIRPGVFDGGFAIESHFPGGMASNSVEVPGVPPGAYIVEAVPPAGYETVKEEDKNVDFGDSYQPGDRALPPACVGDAHLVPPELALFPGVEAPFAGEERPLCDRKQVFHSGTQNTAVNFFVFTEVPKAARAVGFINNDLAAEFDPTSPVFGEKQAPSWLPISFQDWAGNEITRTYCDEFGVYNALLPSTFTVNVPTPTGVSPNMINFVLNHPGPIRDPNNPNQFIVDPYFDPHYSQTPYTFNFESGRTTYLDTPVIPVAAFAGYPNRTLDCEPAPGTPMIQAVMGPQGGPLVCADNDGLTITSVGTILVSNPDYDPEVPGSEPVVPRDFGFGAGGGTVTVGGVPVLISSWSDAEIVALVDTDLISTGELLITREDTGFTSPIGITLHVGDCGNVVHVTQPPVSTPAPIQTAIDAAAPGTLIIVEPGTYRENPIVWKNVKLQGSGAGSTFINASPVPSERIIQWHNKINALIAAGDLVPIGGDFFEATEAPGILVHGREGDDTGGPGQIDGFTVLGGVSGGGIFLAAFADDFEVSNNKIVNNQGTYAGGIACGVSDNNGLNDHVYIHHNIIAKNGGINGAGGVTIFSGSDTYRFEDNFVCGCFTRNVGGGLAHIGLSDEGTIARNTFAFNEIFYGGPIGGEGGGVYVGTQFAADGLSPGTGSVTINSNLLMGNLAGSGSGGGIRAVGVNGADVAAEPNDPSQWNVLNIFNNVIVNNVSAYQGGGIALQDVARANIIHNTIINNDSTATASVAFPPGNLLVSDPQPAGLAGAQHGAALRNLIDPDYSDPTLVNNTVWHNRSFSWDGTLNDFIGGLVPRDPPYWDLHVAGGVPGSQLQPEYCLLTDPSGYDASNISADPLVVAEYQNTLRTAAVLDEGGNFISVRFLELKLGDGNYHLENGSPAIDAATPAPLTSHTALAADFDGQPRAPLCPPDIGADEAPPPVDCNGNDVADSCDIANGTSQDCNINLIPDDCDIASGTSLDDNSNGIPDECETPVTVAGDITSASGAPLPDVEVCGENSGLCATTDANGHYELALPYGQPETVTPCRDGFLFDPPSRSYGPLTADQAGQMFAARLVYDIDPPGSGDDVVGVGDLSLFATSWLQTVPPADASYDFDCDALIGVGDLSYFATAWLKSILDPALAFPACRTCGVQGGLRDRAVAVSVELVPVATLSSADAIAELPTPLARALVGESYYVEVWIRDDTVGGQGLTSVYVDVELPPTHTARTELVEVGALWPLFASGGPTGSVLEDVGGSTLEPGTGSGEWTRVAWVRVRAAGPGTAVYLPAPGAIGLAAYGMGQIPEDAVNVAGTSVAHQAPAAGDPQSRPRRIAPGQETTDGAPGTER